MNAAQVGSRYDVMEDIFRIASGFSQGEADSAKFLVRAVWAMLNNFTGDRSETDKWREVSLLAGRAETLFAESGGSNADLLATQAKILSSEAYDLSEGRA